LASTSYDYAEILVDSSIEFAFCCTAGAASSSKAPAARATTTSTAAPKECFYWK
jgi:hypothetical protein